jgi:hypothetical protein
MSLIVLDTNLIVSAFARSATCLWYSTPSLNDVGERYKSKGAVRTSRQTPRVALVGSTSKERSSRLIIPAPFAGNRAQESRLGPTVFVSPVPLEGFTFNSVPSFGPLTSRLKSDASWRDEFPAHQDWADEFVNLNEWGWWPLQMALAQNTTGGYGPGLFLDSAYSVIGAVSLFRSVSYLSRSGVEYHSLCVGNPNALPFCCAPRSCCTPHYETHRTSAGHRKAKAELQRHVKNQPTR